MWLSLPVWGALFVVYSWSIRGRFDVIIWHPSMITALLICISI